MKGWVFDVSGEPLSPGPPWSYESRARRLLASVRSVLDWVPAAASVSPRYAATTLAGLWRPKSGSPTSRWHRPGWP